MELFVRLESMTEIWEGRVDPAMTVYIITTSKAADRQTSHQFSRFNTTAEAAAWLSLQKQRAMSRGFYARLMTVPVPPPAVKLSDPITKLVEPKKTPEKQKPKEPQPPRVRKVRI